VKRTAFIALVVLAVLVLAIGGWIVEGARKVLRPVPSLVPGPA
jgi:hypothetical protein